jgi:glycosyltransferase involved in cell wall biosynthesis
MTIDSTRISVIIPALNEQDSIGRVINDIPKSLVEEIIVVDNGSIDNTAAVAGHAGATVVKESHRGYGAACLKGIASVTKPDIIVFLDGDYSDYPEEMEHLIAPIRQYKADLVIGSRTLGSTGNKVLLPQAYWGNKLATFMIYLLYRYRYTDLGPFRAIKYSALQKLNMQDRNFGWTIEMQVKAVKQKLKITEVPVKYRARIGKSKITGTFSGTIRAGIKIIYTVIALWF